MRLLGRGVGCVRGGRDVFSGLDFEVPAGEALAVTGRNGSGKTSLLRLIAGLLTPAGGSIALEGGEAELTLAEQAHYLGHRDALKPALSVLENLAFWRDFLGGEIGEAGANLPGSLAQSLASVGLDHATDLPAAFLSAGQRRRLSIARLVAVRRPIWLLDEPSTALDTAGQSLFSALMHSHLAAGGIIIAATHGPLGIEAQELRIGGAAIQGDPGAPRLS
jgi:heme exporter protein A